MVQVNFHCGKFSAWGVFHVGNFFTGNFLVGIFLVAIYHRTLQIELKDFVRGISYRINLELLHVFELLLDSFTRTTRLNFHLIARN